MGDLGGYGIAELPPTGPLFARGPYRALGQKGNPWEVGLQFHIRPRHPCRNYPFHSVLLNVILLSHFVFFLTADAAQRANNCVPNLAEKKL